MALFTQIRQCMKWVNLRFGVLGVGFRMFKKVKGVRGEWAYRALLTQVYQRQIYLAGAVFKK
jgi:hypothetical protein